MERSVLCLLLIALAFVDLNSAWYVPLDKPGECREFLCGRCPELRCPPYLKCCQRGCHRFCVPRFAPFPPCAEDSCTIDAECPGDQKCCFKDCRKQCLSPAGIDKPGSCPNYRCSGPCISTLCGPNEKCYQDGCRRFCSPHYFPYPPCAADSCKFDTDCPWNEKCCFKDCKRQCVSPAGDDKPGSCPNYRCGGPCLSRQCGPNEKCYQDGCRRFCSAYYTPYPPCADHSCTYDTDCPSNKKCCFKDCRRQCVPPAGDDKPGSCPIYRCGGPCLSRQCGPNEKCYQDGCRRFCSGYYAPYPPCVEDACKHDVDCPGNEKCCFKDCKRQCISPAGDDKPGSCPSDQCGLCASTLCGPNEKCYQDGCRRFCSSYYAPYPLCAADSCTYDTDCPWNKKCCLKDCRKQCVPPGGDVHVGICPHDYCGSSCHSRPCPLFLKCCQRGCHKFCAPHFVPCTPCPADSCTSDTDCDIPQKCCYKDCRKQCVPAIVRIGL